MTTYDCFFEFLNGFISAKDICKYQYLDGEKIADNVKKDFKELIEAIETDNYGFTFALMNSLKPIGYLYNSSSSDTSTIDTTTIKVVNEVVDEGLKGKNGFGENALVKIIKEFHRLTSNVKTNSN